MLYVCLFISVISLSLKLFDAFPLIFSFPFFSLSLSLLPLFFSLVTPSLFLCLPLCLCHPLSFSTSPSSVCLSLSAIQTAIRLCVEGKNSLHRELKLRRRDQREERERRRTTKEEELRRLRLLQDEREQRLAELELLQEAQRQAQATLEQEEQRRRQQHEQLQRALQEQLQEAEEVRRRWRGGGDRRRRGKERRGKEKRKGGGRGRRKRGKVTKEERKGEEGEIGDEIEKKS